MTALSATTYIAGNSSVHRLDARSKIILLAIYSVCLFFIDSWLGMAIAAVSFCVALLASGIAPMKVFKTVVPIYFIVAFTLFFNAFIFTDGGLAFSLEGFMRGCFFSIRILLLVWASLIVCFTSTSTQLTEALGFFLSPLRKIHVPADDIAMVFSIALRFIPLTAEEFKSVKDAQWARGAKFDEGPMLERLRSYAAILIPMFVGLFRRADVLAQAMEVRCYGYPDVLRTSIGKKRFNGLSLFATVAGSSLFIFTAICF